MWASDIVVKCKYLSKYLMVFFGAKIIQIVKTNDGKKCNENLIDVLSFFCVCGSFFDIFACNIF